MSVRWLTQPGMRVGHSTTHTSSSSRWAATRNFPILPKLKTVMRLAAPVHVTAMAYFDDNDERFDIPDFIDNPIDALPDSIALLTGQLFYAVGTRLRASPRIRDRILAMSRRVGVWRRSFVTDCLKTTSKPAMSFEVIQQFFERQRWFGRPLIKGRQVFLILPQSLANRLIYQSGYRPVGGRCLESQSLVKVGFQIDGRAFRCLIHLAMPPSLNVTRPSPNTASRSRPKLAFRFSSLYSTAHS